MRVIKNYLLSVVVSVLAQDFSQRLTFPKVQPTSCNVFSIYLFLEIAVRVSSGSSAHHQEQKTVRTASGIVKPILLSAAIVDEMELCTYSSVLGSTDNGVGPKHVI